MPLNVPLTPRSLGPRLNNLKVLLLGTCQLEPLVNAAPRLGFKINHMLMSSIRLAPIPSVDLSGTDAAVVGLTLRQILRDAVGKPTSLSVDTLLTRINTDEEAIRLVEQCRSVLDEMVSALHEVLKTVPTFFLAFLEPSFQYAGNLADRYDTRSPQRVVQKLNEHLYSLTRKLQNFYFLDCNEILNFVGRMHLQDDVIRASTHASFIDGYDFGNDSERLTAPRSVDLTYESGPFKSQYGEALWNLVADNLKVLRQIDPVKLIIVDLDDTLWRGVAAEDSIPHYKRVEGWPLGFIESLLFFKSRGGLLAIASKNEREPTLKRLAAIWQGAIMESDFVSIKINWEPKPENIAQILSETNLLPDNVVFIDDNPREIDEVRSRYPTMRCLGEDHMDWRRIILRSPETQVPVVTAESIDRTHLVRARLEREAMAKTMSREEWLESLGLEQSFTVVRDASAKAFERGFELLNKTNQFNTTGRRWVIAEIDDFFREGGVLVLTGLKDKTVDNGIIGAALIKAGEIVQAVLSCRVFDLGAEIGMGRFATQLALTQAEKVRAKVIDTGKNFSCHKYFERLGFELCGEYYETIESCEAPSWIAVSRTDVQ